MSRIAISLWLLLWTAQWLATATLFAEGGLLPWEMLSHAPRRRVTARLRQRMTVGRSRALLVLQMGVAIALPVATSMATTVMCLLLLIASVGGFIALSGEYWSDGADKIGVIAMAGNALIGIGVLIADPGVALAGVLVTGGQLALCYTTSGFAKMVQRDWRSGAELAGVMATDTWGHAAARTLSRHRSVALIATWILILGEALFPLALLAPQGWLIAALAGFLLFHLATALVMGLNTFPWAFATAYPAVLLLGRVVRGLIGWTG